MNMNIFFIIAQQSMFFTIPLMIVALGGLFSERSGIVNIALEGKMIVGAFSGILFISTFQESLPGQPILILGLLVAMASGMLVSLLHAFASINMNANQIISGVAINMFAPAFAIYVARNVGQTQQVPFIQQFRIPSVPILGDIPYIGPMFFQNTFITTFIGFGILVLSTLVLYKTPFGLRLRACGEHPQAADSVGVNVYGIRYAGVIISGALAGIGGVTLIIPTQTNFNATVSGYGFLALAVLIFGSWKPVRVLFAALFFGIMQTIASSFTSIDFLMNLGIDARFYRMAPYVATLIVLAFTSKNMHAPRAAGQPYDKGGR